MQRNSRQLLTKEQREQWTKISPTIDEWELGAHYTLLEQDLEIIRQRRKDANRIGYAVQLCVLRHTGWPLSEIQEIPYRVLHYIAKQIQVDPESFYQYAKREETRWEHMGKILEEYGYQTFNAKEYRWAAKEIFPRALENRQTLPLIQLTIDLLRQRKIILPAVTTIERLVWETRRRAEEKILRTLNSMLTNEQKKQLD